MAMFSPAGPTLDAKRAARRMLLAAAWLTLGGATIVEAGDVAAAPEAAPARLTFKALASHSVDALAREIPDGLRRLDGTNVTVTGYLIPFAEDGQQAREFLLMRAPSGCCPGGGHAANEFVVVRLAESVGAPLASSAPLTFTGVFRVEPVKQGDALVRCFRLDDARVL